jgi:hypothetical protein
MSAVPAPAGVQLPLGTREFLLERLQAVVATLAPGVTFTPPSWLPSPPQRPIMTALGGRVYAKLRGQTQIDGTDKPYVVILTSPASADKVRPLDDNLYERKMVVGLIGYCQEDTAGDGTDSIVRGQLNQLLSDLQLAVEMFPYWTNPPAVVLPAIATLGPIIVVPLMEWTEPSMSTADGQLILEYEMTYYFHRFSP